MKTKKMKIFGLAIILAGLAAFFSPAKNFSGTILALGLVLLALSFMIPFGKHEASLVEQNFLLRVTTTTPDKDGAVEFRAKQTPKIGCRLEIPPRDAISQWENSPPGSNPIQFFANCIFTVARVEERDWVIIVTVFG